MTEPLYSGEAILLNWNDNKSGRKIVLQIEKDGPGAHPFDGFAGERFAVVIVGPLAADQHEEQVSKGGGRNESASPDATPAAAKPKKRWNEMPPSQRAALLVKDAEFQRYATECYDPDAVLRFDADAADEWLKDQCKINSKRDLDTDLGERRFVRDQFERLEGNFHAWRQAKQLGAA